jgi:hypothetical protein
MCQAAWAELSTTLKLIDTTDVPEPGPEFEQTMWARIEQALPAAKTSGVIFAPEFTRKRPPTSFLFKRLIPLVGLAAAVTLAFVAGRYGVWPFTRPATTTTAPVSTAVSADAGARRERVLLTALGDHFDQTQTLLVELLNAPDGGPVDLNFERATANELVSSSRLYRQTAQQSGHVRLAQMLEDLESVLVEVANSPEKVDKKDFDSLRKRIDGNDLLFKVRAITTEIHERQKHLSTVSEGTL